LDALKQSWNLSIFNFSKLFSGAMDSSGKTLKIFILKFVVFISLLLVLLHFIVLKDNPYLEQKSSYLRNMHNYQSYLSPILILGDSQPGAIPQEVLNDRIYNFAYGSDSLFEMYIKLKYALKLNPDIKMILISHDYHVLSKYRTSVNNKLLIQSFTDSETYKELYQEDRLLNPLANFLSRWPVFEPNVYVFVRRRIAELVANTIQLYDGILVVLSIKTDGIGVMSGSGSGGGNCTKVCSFEAKSLLPLWTRVFEINTNVYSVVSYIENLNPNLGIENINYTITVVGQNGETLDKRNGNTRRRRKTWKILLSMG